MTLSLNFLQYELYHDNSRKLRTTSTGIAVDDHLDMDDNHKVRLGSSADSELYFDGTNTILDHTSGSGTLYLRGDALRLQTTQSTPEDYIVCSEGGYVQLYHNNASKIQTDSDRFY